MIYEVAIKIHNAKKKRRLDAKSGDEAIKLLIAGLGNATGRQKLLPVWAEFSARPVTTQIRSDENGEAQRRSETVGEVEANFSGRIQYAR